LQELLAAREQQLNEQGNLIDKMKAIWKTKVEIRIHEPKRGFQAQKKYFLGRIRN
jgi:hypothetical protein